MCISLVGLTIVDLVGPVHLTQSYRIQLASHFGLDDFNRIGHLHKSNWTLYRELTLRTKRSQVYDLSWNGSVLSVSSYVQLR